METIKTKSPTSRYLVVGILLALFNYGLYSFIANFIIKDNNFLWASTLIATFITTIVAYISHSKITWKERNITKTAIYKFFIWNFTIAFAVGPWITQLFSLITPIYDFAFNISQNLQLSFSYDFIQSTGAFCFTSAVTMLMNFLFYDKFVFGKNKSDQTKVSKENSENEEEKEKK